MIGKRRELKTASRRSKTRCIALRSYSTDLGDGRLGALLEGVGKTTLSTSLPVLVPCHKDTGTTSRSGALSSESLDLAVRSDLVVLEDSHLDLLPLVLDLLGGGLVVSFIPGLGIEF